MPVPAPPRYDRLNSTLDQLLAEVGPEVLTIELARRGLLSMPSSSCEDCSMERALFEFEEALRFKCSRGTRKTYQSECNLFRRFLEQRQMLDQTVKEVFTDKVLGDYLSSRTWTVTTRNKKVAVLRKFHRFAKRNQWLDTDMPEVLRIERVDQQVPRALSPESVKELIDLAKRTKYGYRFQTLVILMLATGCRIGEILGVRIGDIDWTNMKMTVFGKRHPSGRPVYLGPEGTRFLRNYVEVTYGRDACSSPRFAGLYVFSASGGVRPLSANSVEETFKRLIVRMKTLTDEEKQYHTPHSLRHTFATSGLLAGVDLYTLAQLLGHEDVSTTQVYLTVKDAHLQKAAERMQGELQLNWG
jgi:integrase/recombinase XerD